MSKLLAIAVVAALTCATTQAAEPTKKYVVPRTEFGHPDLRGVWNFSSNTPIERPAQYKDREFLTREEAAAISSTDSGVGRRRRDGWPRGVRRRRLQPVLGGELRARREPAHLAAHRSA